MKRFGFLFFMMSILVVITLSSSTCRRVDDPEPIDISDTGTVDTNISNFDKPAKITIRAKPYQSTNQGVGGATVYMALTLDSMKEGKYIAETKTDGNGDAVFDNLYAKTLDGTTLRNSKYYYFNAWVIVFGDSLTTNHNANSDQHKEFQLKPNQVRNEELVMTLP